MKVKILECLYKEDTDLLLNTLKRKIAVANYKSVQRNCEFLHLANLINIENQRIAGIKHNIISISDNGKKFIEKFNEEGYEV